MATVTKSIGSGLDYTTVTGHEADLDNGAVYSSGDIAIGQLANQAFDEDIAINGGATVGLTSITYQPASGAEHDGTAGSGARVSRTAASAASVVDIANASVPVTWEHIEVDGNDQGADTGVLHSGAGTGVVRRCLVHHVKYEGAADVRGIRDTGAGDTYFLRNTVYAISRAATSRNVYGIEDASGGVRNTYIDNNTVHDISHGSTSANCYRILNDSANKYMRNNVATNADTCFAGTYSTGTYSNNVSSDSTAPGSGSVTSVTTSNQYVSITGGSEDLHLKSGADCIDAGTNLGSTNDVNIDIDVYTVTGTWDVGSDEYVAAGGATGKSNPTIGPLRGPLAGPIG